MLPPKAWETKSDVVVQEQGDFYRATLAWRPSRCRHGFGDWINFPGRRFPCESCEPCLTAVGLHDFVSEINLSAYFSLFRSSARPPLLWPPVHLPGGHLRQ